MEDMKYLHYCHDRALPGEKLDTPPDPGFEAAIVLAKRWAPGTTLHVRFLEGTAAQKATVKQFAVTWTQYANIHFAFDDAPNAEIRIGFDPNDGSWSFIGRDALGIPANQRTMNFGWLDEAVVLHEFGHALGLIHEHQNPDGGIQWNEAEVIKSLKGPPNNWDEATIRHNVLDRYKASLLRGTKFDPDSIMLYFFPPSWTKDGKGTHENTKLSATDKSFIASDAAYPGAASPAPVAPMPLPVTEEKLGAFTLEAGATNVHTFTVPVPGTFTIETFGDTDVVATLKGPDGKTVASDDDSGDGNNARIRATLGEGAHTLEIRNYDEKKGGPYKVRVLRHA